MQNSPPHLLSLLMMSNEIDVGRRIRQWLLEEEYSFDEEPGLGGRTDYECGFIYCIKKMPTVMWAFEERPQINVIKWKNKTDSVQVFCMVPDLRPARVVPHASARDIQDKICLAIWNAGCDIRDVLGGFTVVNSVLGDGRISRTIYYDGLTKHSFFETISAVERCFHIARSILEKELNP
jgi:hypothetical protein